MANQDFISIAPTEDTAPNSSFISIQGGNKVNLPESVVKDRAFKANLGLGDNSPGLDAITTSIANGTEDILRSNIASTEALKNRQAKLNIINDFVSQKQGQSFTADEVSALQGFASTEETPNPSTVLESTFASKYFEGVISRSDPQTSVLTKALGTDPTSNEDLDVVTDILARKEIALTKLQDLQKVWEDTGILGTAKEVGQQFVPFFSWAMTNNAVKDAKVDSILPGKNLREQVEHLWLLPKEEFNNQLTEAIGSISKYSTLDALKFVQAVVAYGTSDSLIDNALGITDVATVVPVGAIGKAGISAGKALKGLSAAEALSKGADVAASTKTALKGLLKATEGPLLDGVKVAEAAGNTDVAAVANVTKRLNSLKEADSLGKSVDLRYNLPSIFNPSSITDDAGVFSRELADRLEGQLRAQGQILEDALTGVANVSRLTPEAEVAAITEAKDVLRARYVNLDDSVVNVGHVYDGVTNTYHVELQLGTVDGKLFSNQAQAAFVGQDIYKLNTNEFRVIQKGNGAYISITKPVREDLESVREALIQTNNATPTNLANQFIGMLRSSSETTSKFNTEQRLGVLGGSSEVVRYMNKVAENIGSLPTKSRKKMMAVFEANRVYVDPKDPTKQGMFFNTVGEFSDFFQSRFGTLPTEAETKAYFSYVQINDFDYLVRNFGLYRDKARVGTERFQLKLKTTEGDPKLGKSNSFDGVLRTELPPRGDKPYRFYHYDAATGEGRLYNTGSLPSEDWDHISNLINSQNYKVIELYAPTERPLKSLVGDEVVNFVITKEWESRAIDWQQLPRAPGGHREYVTPYFVKQPTVRTASDGRAIYEGDAVAFGQETYAEAVKFSKSMDTAREFLKAGDSDGLAEFLSRNLPFSPKEFESFFKPKFLEDGTEVPPRFSLDTSFLPTKSGQRTLDAHPDFSKRYAQLEDMYDTPYNLSAMSDSKFTSQRDPLLWTVKENYENGGPIYRVDTARMLDPMSSMTRTMRGVMTDRFMNDYKISSIESYLQKYMDLFDASEDVVRANPMYYLKNGSLKETGSDTARLSAAKNERLAILNFLQNDTALGRHIKDVQQKVMDQVYNVGGQRASDYAVENLLPLISDPTRFLRSVAFHSKMGLFNPTQVFVQGQTLAHLAALSPSNAIPGLSFGSFARFAMNSDNPKVLEAIASKSSMLGFGTPDMFIEAFTAMRRSGWANVGSESVWATDVLDPTVFNGTVGKFLDKGTIFFKETEKLLRTSAWGAAYKEWAKANPGRIGAITDRDISQIRWRADMLTVNMTKASMASWEKGFLSVPFQFQSYMARMSDQLLGTRLSNSEKIRMLGTYGLFYGIPSAASIGTLYPFYEDVQKYALENGINIDGKVFQTLVEGFPSMVVSSLGLGEFNIAQRYAPGGITLIKDIVNGDKTPLEILFGASGTIATDTLRSAQPVVWNLGKAFTGNFEDLPIALADGLDALRNISTVDTATRIYMAHTMGRYLSKNGVYISDTNTFEQALSAITGLSSRDVSNTFLMLQSAKDRKDVVSETNKFVTKYFQRAVIDFSNKDEASGEANLRRAKSIMIMNDFTPDEMSKAFTQAIGQNGIIPLVQKIPFDFWQKAPASQQKPRMDQFLKGNQ